MLNDIPVLSHLQKFLRILVNSRNSVMCYGGQLDYKVECSYYYVQLLNKYFESFKVIPRPWNMVDYEIFTSLIEDYDSKSSEFKNLTIA